MLMASRRPQDTQHPHTHWWWANERGVAGEWMQADMRVFDLGPTFDLVFIAAYALLHLHEAEDRERRCRWDL